MNRPTRTPASLLAIFSGALIALSVGCGGGGGEAAALCEEVDACGKTPSAAETKSCKEEAEQCPDEADDVAACSKGNLECVEGSSEIKSGKCESEISAYLICALGGG